MRPVSSLSLLTLGFVGSWQILLFWLSVYILVFGIRDKRRMVPAKRNLLLILLCFVNYTLFQCTIDFTAQKSVTQTMIRITEGYAALPALCLIAVCAALTVLEISLVLSMHRWYDTHITSASIKETIETLPVGICAYEPSGKIMLRNKTMEQICRNLTGSPLLNGIEFVQTLEEKKSDLSNFVMPLPDYSVWSFTKDEICNENTCFTLLIAYNVTEAYQKTQVLEQRQKAVQALNRELVAYNRKIEQITAQQEILNAKVRIHDELGSGLLAIKRCLVTGSTDRQRAELLERLKGNIRFLQEGAVSAEQDEYALILSTAEDLGVSVQIIGTLPQTQPEKHIMATAIHECFTNIIRHTDCDTLNIIITEDTQYFTARFTDNNTRPVGEIAETGGLSSLRDLVEHAAATMKITTDPRFCLTLSFPKEVEKNGLSGFDRR